MHRVLQRCQPPTGVRAVIKAWEKSENLSAKIYGKKVSASGSGPFQKLDILGQGIYHGWRGENKHTEGKSFSLTWDIVHKGICQALQMGARPFYILDFQARGRFILLREEDWTRMNEEYADALYEVYEKE